MLRLREATPADNRALIALTKACPMEGKISLRIDRDPDFFALCRLRGETSVLLVESDGAVVGCISLTMQRIWFEGAERNALYLADLKVHPDFRRSRTVFLLMEGALRFSEERGADLAYLVTPGGNAPLLRLLRGRAVFPPFGEWTRFAVWEFRPGRRRSFASQLLKESEWQEAFDLWQTGPGRFSLAHAFTAAGFAEAVKSSGTELYGIREKGRLLAVGALWDPAAYKQNVVIAMPTGLRIGVGLQRLAAKVLPISPLPGKGEAIRLLNLRFFATAQGAEAAGEALFRDLLGRTYAKGASFLSYGWDENNGELDRYRRYRHFAFESILMGVKLRDFPKGESGLFGLDFSEV